MCIPNLPSRALRLVAVLATLGAAAACYPGGPTSTAETDVAVTFFDSTADFGSIRTWAMPDEVVELEGSQPTTDEFDDQILGDVARNMNGLGYERLGVGATAIPDVVVLVSKSRARFTYASYPCYPGWGFWPGWGWWGWAPGWGCSYPWPVVSSFDTGTIIIDMYDPDSFDGNEITAIWSGALNGVASSSADVNSARITRGIDQAFGQSPYLGAR